MKYLVIQLLSLIVFTPLVAQQEKPNMPWIDLSHQKDRQTIIAGGRTDLYNGHPTTIMFDDNLTILCAWSSDHGGKASFLGESKDAGKTWEVRKTPADWQEMRNCPSIYRLTDKEGKERIFVFCAHPDMGQSYSEDGGKTWTPVKSLNKPCIMAFSSIIQLKNGDYMGLYHRGEKGIDGNKLTLWKAISKDGGVTWSESELVGEMTGRSPCEPFAFRTPDEKRLVCVARE
ncbi:MAG: sialidase family protein, partial [Phocaeicola sp.]